MPNLEKPHICDNCGGELLADIGKVSKWNALLHTGGPGQEPRPMGIQWAFYRCITCGFEAPWRKTYVGSRELTVQYSELFKICQERFKESQINKNHVKMIEGLLDAKKIMGSLPGSTGFEEALGNALVPLMDQLRVYENKLKGLEQELQKRKGGRPPMTDEEKLRRRLQRESKKGR
jgi:hypothetical protein